jgi:hypothetical protein
LLKGGTSQPHLIIMKPRADVVDISSSDTEALLDSLFLSPAHDSPASHSRESFDPDSFENWPEPSDMAVSVYIALSADASSSRMHAINVPLDGLKSRFRDLPTKKMRKTRRQKAAPTDALQKRSKRAKVDVDRALAASAPHDGSVSIADFDKSEWEIMYPLFVAEGLVDPSARVIRRNT